MHYRKKTDYEIDLKDAVFYLLRKWRGILLVALIGAILMGGYRVWSQSGVAVNEKKIATLQADIDVNQAVIDGNKAYIADQKARLAANGDLIAAEEAKIAQLQATRQQLVQQLQACSGRQSEAVAELVIRLDQQIADVDNRITQAEKAVLALQKEKATIPDSIMDILAANTKLANTNSTKKTQIAELKAVGLTASDVAAKIAVGAVLGFLAAAVVYAVRYLADHRLRSASHWRLEWTVPVLGDLYGCPQKKNPVDRIIDRLAGGKVADEAQQLALAAAGIRNFVKEKEPKVLLVGTAQVDAMAQLQEKLAAQMDGKGPGLETVGNPTVDAAALLRVKGQQVVLVEDARQSCCKQIQKLLDVLALSGAKVLGVVIL